jgi:RNA polymerase sigma-70 factor (ECF subfamily)
MSPSPIIALNRSVAVARVHGPAAGLEAMDRISRAHRLETYHLFHAVRGSFESELGRFNEALASYRKAESLAVLPSERAFLARRIQECTAKVV